MKKNPLLLSLLAIALVSCGTPRSSQPAPSNSEPVPTSEPAAPTSEPAPETSEPAPTSEPAAPTSEPAPETSEPAPETSEPVPETSEPAPETSEPVPETSEPIPETSESAPAISESVPGTSEPAPTTSDLAPATSESATSEPEPSTSESAPATSESAPATSEPAPQTSEPVHSSSGEISSSEAYVPTPVSVKDLPAKQRTFYQLLVYSFADGNNDGIGDFKGIIDHLDYLEELGIGGLWLSPIHPADSYHAYDVIDYYGVNSVYEVTVSGKKYDLASLLDACHERGIKVILDLVLNHSSPNCAWRSSHPDWYKTPDAFGGGMKDFNYDSKGLRDEIKNVGRYWLNKGVDGFRLDAAKWIYNYGGTFDAADDEKNYVWWNEFYNACKDVKSDVYMIGEVLSDMNLSDDRIYYKTGMDSNFDFEIREKIYDAARYASPNNYTSFLPTFQSEIRGYNDNAIEASVLSNHDIGRFSGFADGISDPAQLALAGMMSILSPGNSYVYYGEEVGLTGSCEGTSQNFYNDLNFRTPMPWTKGTTKPQNYLSSYVPSRNMQSQTLSGQAADKEIGAKSGMFATYSATIKAKNATPVLYCGEVKKGSNGGHSEVGSFAVSAGQKSATVIFNCGSTNKTITLSDKANMNGNLAYTGLSSLNGTTLEMVPYSAVVLDKAVSVTKATGDHSTPSSSGESGPTIAAEPIQTGGRVTSESTGRIVLHCYDSQNWGNLNCYAWVEQTTYCGSWPGSKITSEGNGWYRVEIAHGASNVIFNNGSSQTVDLFVNGSGEYWFVIGKGSKPSGNWYNVYPFAD